MHPTAPSAPNPDDVTGDEMRDSGITFEEKRGAYLKGVRETCRNATVVHDKYHVIANLVLATEKVRRREQKQRPELKDSRWLLRKNPENLNEEQAVELAVLTQSNLASVKAYQMRLAFQDAYRLPSANAARRRLAAWGRWVRLGRQKFGALFTEMEKFGACQDFCV